MRVGILTFQKLYNFGACLQCYALWKYLSLRGHDVKVIDLLVRHHDGFIQSKNVVKLNQKRNFKFYLKSIFRFFHEFRLKVKYRKEITKRCQSFKKFWSLCSYTKCYRSFDSLRKDPPEFDIYCTGSDQVWNPGIHYDWEAYFFPYVSQGKKISYAASFGRDIFEKELAPHLSKWLHDYSAVSVREASGVKIIEENVGIHAELVLDPIFLLTKETWNDVMVSVEESEPFILCIWYSAGKRLKSFLDFSSKLQEKSRCHVVIIGDAGSILNPKTSLDFRQNIGPGEFLYLIAHAMMVLSDSFHGAALSIVLAKSFFVVLHNNSMDDRKQTLFSSLDLQDNIIHDVTEIDLEYVASCPEVNRRALDDKLSALREKSFQFLNHALSEK